MDVYNHPPLEIGMKVTNQYGDGLYIGTIGEIYGDENPHAVLVHSVENLDTGYKYELPFAWLVYSIEIASMSIPNNPLPFDEGA